MTLDAWFRDPSNPVELQQFLQTPIIKRALDVLVYSKLPAPTPLPETDTLAHAAIVNARREGYYTFLRDLTALTVEPKQNQDLSKPWKGKHIKPESE
jgi:hypothetical protein